MKKTKQSKTTTKNNNENPQKLQLYNYQFMSSSYDHVVFLVVAGVVLFLFTLVDFISQYVQRLSSLFLSMLYV